MTCGLNSEEWTAGGWVIQAGELRGSSSPGPSTATQPAHSVPLSSSVLDPCHFHALCSCSSFFVKFRHYLLTPRIRDEAVAPLRTPSSPSSSHYNSIFSLVLSVTWVTLETIHLLLAACQYNISRLLTFNLSFYSQIFQCSSMELSGQFPFI